MKLTAQMCARLPILQRQLVVDYIRRLSACCDTHTDTSGGDAVMDVVGRFLRRLLQLLADETQSLSQPDDGAFVPQDAFGAFGLVSYTLLLPGFGSLPRTSFCAMRSRSRRLTISIPQCPLMISFGWFLGRGPR